MFELHAVLVRPLLEAVGARHVVEVGADQAEHTALLLDYVRGVGGHLDVIDPVVSAPLEQLAAGASALALHRGPSLTHLRELPVADAVLIDGDHNYFTVGEELRLLHAVVDRAAAAFPLVLLHDVGWPYGRRDMYYDPDRIPPEHRLPHATRGVRVGRSELVADGPPGLNAGYANAVREGGARNGVLTAVEDFVAGHADLRLDVFAGFHGLAVVSARGRAADNGALAAILALAGQPLFRELTAAIEAGRLRLLEQLHDEAWRSADAQARAARDLQAATAHAAELQARLADAEAALARAAAQAQHPFRTAGSRLLGAIRPARR